MSATSRHESGHLEKKVNETVSTSVCLGGMKDRENKEIVLSSCHECYWQESGTLHVVSTVCGYMGGQRSEYCSPDYS